MNSFVLLSEYTTTKYRSYLSISFFNAFIASTALFALKAYYIRDWRLLSLVCTAPYIVTVLSYFFVPESIRWIRLKGSEDLLKKTFERIAYWNGTQLPENTSIEPVYLKTQHLMPLQSSMCSVHVSWCSLL